MNMMKRFALGAVALPATFALASGCDSGDDPAGLSEGPGEFKSDFKTSNAFFTLMAGPVAGNSPHGTSQIWYSSNIRSLEGTTGFTVPVGTVAIKEFDMEGDGTFDGLAVMIKQEAGYDADRNDWYYDMRDLAGNVMPEPPPGPIAMCSGCHAAAASLDYLPGFTLR